MSTMDCEKCGQSLPISQFQDLHLGAYCRACVMGRDLAVREQAKVQEALKLKAKEIAGSLIDSKGEGLAPEAGKVRAVLAEIYANFGGPTGYAAHLHHVIMELSRRKPMPASVGHLMINLMKLHHNIEQTEELVTARDMTDEQLRQEQQMAMMKIVLDAAVDPQKRQMLELMLSKQGLTIADADPHKTISAVADHLQQQEAEEQAAKERAAQELESERNGENSILDAFLESN